MGTIKSFKKFIEESIWSDIQDRSSGDVVRKEDDVNHLDRDGLYDYLTCHYKNTNSFAPIYNSDTFDTIKVPFLIQGGSDGVYLSFDENEVSIPYSSPYKVKGLFSKLANEFLLKSDSKTGHTWYIISPKDGSEVTNTFFIYVIDFLIDNIPDSFEKGVKKIVNESIWSDIQDRSSGDVVRKEDEMTQDDLDAVDDFIFGFATRVVWDGVRDSLTNFLKYIDENPEALDCDITRVKKYVEDNWHKGICDDVEEAIEQEDKEKEQDMNESIWSDIQDRSSGDVVRKEDDVNLLDLNEFYKYIKDQYKTKVEYIDLDAMGDGNGDVLGVDITENIILFYKPKRGHILLSWSRVKIPMPFFDELTDRFKVENPNAMRRIITEKDGSCTNKTFVDVIEFFLRHKESMMNESIWSDIQDRSSGDVVRKEDDVNLLDKNGLYEYLISHYKSVEGIDIKSCISCGKSYINLCVFTYPKETRYSILLDILNCRVKVRTPYIKRWPANLLDMIYKKYNREDIIDENRDYMTFITPKEGKGNNQFYIDFLDMILNNVDKPLLKKVINESIWSDIQDRSSGETIRKEDERHKILERLLATYIKLFAESCYYHNEYTSGSYPDFRAYIKDFRDNPRIEEVCPDDSYFDDLLNYVNKETWHNQIDDTIMEMTDRLYKGEHLITNEVIEVLRKHNVNESIWSDIQDRSAGDVVRKEEFTEEFIDKVKSELIGFTMLVIYYIKDYELTFDGFYKYLEENYLEENENPDEVKKIIYYVKTHKDECDKLLEQDIKFENKLLDEKVNVYLLRFVDNIVYDEKYHNTLSDIKKFASEIFKRCKSSYDFHMGKKLVFKDKSELFNDYIEDKWKDGSLKQKIDNLIKNENDEISKYGFVKEPGKTISETVNDWWYSLDEDERNDLGWDEFGDDAEGEYYTDHNPDYNEYTGEDFEADEWWDDAYGIRKVKIYCSEHSKTNESIWSDIQDRSSGDTVRKEDEVLTDMEINSLNEFILMYCRKERAHYIKNYIVPPPPSRRKENDYEGLIKYIEDRRDENLFTNVGDYNKIIRFIKKNWDKLNMDKYIKKYIFSPDMMKDKKIVECEGVPGGLTPADVGGMGAAYFHGPNGEPGSGDLPSPTGIVYHQVAPYTMFLKDIKKKKKKKKFRIEDEPCVHSKNSKTYDYVDDFREYVDRTYNNIDKRK